MSEYICKRCLYSSSKKCNVRTHLKKKKICEVVGEGWNIDRESLIQELYPEKEYKCVCGADFTLNTNLIRHKKGCEKCKSALEEENEKLKEQLKQAYANKKTQITNNTINIENIETVNIRNLGSEYTDHITDEMIENALVYHCGGSVLHITKSIMDHPENQNIKITNKNGEYLYAFKDGKWQRCSKIEAFDNKIDVGYGLTSNYYNYNNKAKITDKLDDNWFKIGAIDQQFDLFETRDKQFIKSTHNKINLYEINK